MSHQYWSNAADYEEKPPLWSVSLPALLRNLAEKGVELWFEGERLRYRLDRAACDATIGELAKFETRIVAFLRGQASRQKARYPVSMGQRAMWLLNQQAPESAAYHMAAPIRVRSPIDISAMRHAVQALADRHATLRTTYHYVDDVLLQEVLGADTPEFDLHAVPGLPEEELLSKIRSDFQRPFDLARGPTGGLHSIRVGPVTMYCCLRFITLLRMVGRL